MRNEAFTKNRLLFKAATTTTRTYMGNAIVKEEKIRGWFYVDTERSLLNAKERLVRIFAYFFNTASLFLEKKYFTKRSKSKSTTAFDGR
jgi:hypothetical protein